MFLPRGKVSRCGAFFVSLIHFLTSESVGVSFGQPHWAFCRGAFYAICCRIRKIVANRTSHTNSFFFPHTKKYIRSTLAFGGVKTEPNSDPKTRSVWLDLLLLSWDGFIKRGWNVTKQPVCSSKKPMFSKTFTIPFYHGAWKLRVLDSTWLRTNPVFSSFFTCQKTPN